MNAPEWKQLFIGCIGAGVWGAYPFLYGIAFGQIYEVSLVVSYCIVLAARKTFLLVDIVIRCL
jgi:hypothetical protein